MRLPLAEHCLVHLGVLEPKHPPLPLVLFGQQHVDVLIQSIELKSVFRTMLQV